MQQKKYRSKEEFIDHCRGFMRVRRMSLRTKDGLVERLFQ